MSSVCDDCKKKNICKPSREYHFMCQWKDADGKQKIATRSEWGITPAAPTFCSESREDGWVAIKPRRENPSACRGDESAHPSLSILTYTI